MSDEYENNSEILVGLGFKVETILNGAAADFKKKEIPIEPSFQHWRCLYKHIGYRQRSYQR